MNEVRLLYSLVILPQFIMIHMYELMDKIDICDLMYMIFCKAVILII